MSKGLVIKPTNKTTPAEIEPNRPPTSDSVARMTPKIAFPSIFTVVTS